MPSLYLNSYKPLAWTPFGIQAGITHGIPPFVDGSIRREPDLEHHHPSISCLCRKGKFAPRLAVGDVVVYITCKHRYGDGASHWRLTAVLRVVAKASDHAEAAGWYRERGLHLPNNCMVDGNDANPLARSHGKSKHETTDVETFHRKWDQDYRVRSRKHPHFVICDKLWSNLGWSAPRLSESDFMSVFGRVPGTHNPGRLEVKHLQPLLSLAGIEVLPSSPRTPPTAAQ